MRVLIVGLNYSPERTGIAPYTAGLAAGLAKGEHRVRVLTAMPHYPEWRIPAEYGGLTRRERVEGVSVVRLRHYVPSRPTGLRRLAAELAFGARAVLARWGRPDVVVLVSPALFATGIALIRSVLFGIPTVVWMQDVYTLGLVETRGRSRQGLVAKLVAETESAVLTRASGVAVIHRRFLEVTQRLGVARDRIAVIRNWTHLPSRPATDRIAARARLGWRDDEIVVLHSGAMGRKQDLGNVLAAARLADERGAAVRFVLMGNGGERPRLEKEAEGVGAVTFLDPLPGDEFQEALVAADVLLVNEHAGLREMAVPSKLTSYFSSGRPVLAASDAESVTSEEIAASEGGIRIDPGRPDLLVDAALALGDDPDLAARLGAAGRQYQRTVLSEDAALNAFGEWLGRVVDGSRRSSLAARVREILPSGRVLEH